jgi:hypothetical protein
VALLAFSEQLNAVTRAGWTLTCLDLFWLHRMSLQGVLREWGSREYHLDLFVVFSARVHSDVAPSVGVTHGKPCLLLVLPYPIFPFREVRKDGKLMTCVTRDGIS